MSCVTDGVGGSFCLERDELQNSSAELSLSLVVLNRLSSGASIGLLAAHR